MKLIFTVVKYNKLSLIHLTNHCSLIFHSIVFVAIVNVNSYSVLKTIRCWYYLFNKIYLQQLHDVCDLWTSWQRALIAPIIRTLNASVDLQCSCGSVVLFLRLLRNEDQRRMLTIVWNLNINNGKNNTNSFSKSRHSLPILSFNTIFNFCYQFVYICAANFEY